MVFFYSVQGVGGRRQGGYRGAPYKKNGGKKNVFFYSVQGVGGVAAGGGGYRGQPPIQLSRGPKGPSRWPKVTSPTQELEVGARRAPYLLVCYINTGCIGLIYYPGYIINAIFYY